jgi:multidrug efflux pump subunit AcrA (membrane-fusion protein)
LIRIYLENPDMTLLQGMFARARVPYEVMQGVLRVPLEALLEQVRDNDNNTVFMVDSTAKAQLVRIKIGTSDPNYAQVLEGLKENDRVVVHGKDMLSSKQPVNATDLPAPPDEHLFSPQASGQDKSSEREKDRKTPDALPGSSDSGDAK